MGERPKRLRNRTVVRFREFRAGDPTKCVSFSSFVPHSPGDVGVITEPSGDGYRVLVPYRSANTFIYYRDEFDVLQEPFTEGKEP